MSRATASPSTYVLWSASRPQPVSVGQTVDGLRVGVSITGSRWPDPRKTVQITVGKLVAYGGVWDADSRTKAEATLAAILSDQPDALAYLTRALEEVPL